MKREDNMPFLFFLLAKKNRELIVQPRLLNYFKRMRFVVPDGMLLHALTSFAEGRQLLRHIGDR